MEFVDARPQVAGGSDSDRSRWACSLVCAVAVLLSAASTAPSPMYVLYQERWHFSTATTTVVFAVYCLCALTGMVLFGSLSDTAGRRPVLLLALGLVAGSTLLFAFADGVGWLLAARALQGFGGGIGGCAVAAALIDLAPAGALLGSLTPIVGIGAGALGAGALVEHGPAPTVLTYVVLLVLLVGAAAGVLFLPETVPGARGRGIGVARRISVPVRARRAFLALSLPVVAVWAVGGLYLGLGPLLAAELLGSRSSVVDGLVVTALAGAGTLAQVSCRGVRCRTAMAAGSWLLLGGLALVLVALSLGSTALFFTATALLGFGWGATYLAAFRLLSELAAPGRRGELMAAVNVVAYIGTAFPAIGLGLAVDAVGTRGATTAFIVAVGTLVLVALAGSAAHVPAERA
ncbi:MFS transporter [Saccharothrix lopnurensis]|uniref:MFS transporter n=1 Tax=Saccharothrix lopnurensis TaxID=1670621 RepID=A0ABW1PHJ9_9PSEU